MSEDSIEITLKGNDARWYMTALRERRERSSIRMIFYYATVVAGPNAGKVIIEPIRHHEGSLGQGPRWCCEQFHRADAQNMFRKGDGPGEPAITFAYPTPSEQFKVKFCPFCGTKVEFEAHLSIKEKEREQKYRQTYYEETKKP